MLTLRLCFVKCEEFANIERGAVKGGFAPMTKEDRIGVRVPAELKRALIQVAKDEGRSLAQVCEIFLRGGLLLYKDQGSKYLHRLLSRQKKESSG
jgi:hypothetical protein